jgi:hypothetical protein
MVNFTNAGSRLANDVFSMMKNLGYHPHIQKIYQKKIYLKYTVRLSKNVDSFINEIGLWKE